MLKCSTEGCDKTNKEDFYGRSGRPGKFMGVCKEHHNQGRTKLNRSVKQRCIDYLGGSCQLCGYKRCNSALELHHKDPNEKDPDYLKLRNRSFEKIEKELDKCALLCSNCHREVHAGLATI
jgi:5-methylcytosine-specific restriction endonuclease McrA